MPALLVNENFPQPALRRLREAGVSVDSVEELMQGAADIDVMAYARDRALWLVTFDRDYGELVFARGVLAPPTIIYIRQEPFPPTRPAELLLALLAQSDEITGMFVTVSERSTRKRTLPGIK